MKVTFDLENKEVGEALINYIKGSIENLVTLMQLDCNVEIVGYETRPDNQQDIELVEIINVFSKQVLYTFEVNTGIAESLHPMPKKPHYDC